MKASTSHPALATSSGALHFILVTALCLCAALTGASTQKLSLASAAAKLSSTSNLSLEGTAQASMKGGMVEVKADGMLTAESTGVATLKGAMTNVQGNLVNLG